MTNPTKNAKTRYKAKITLLRVELYPTDKDIIDKLAERLSEGEAKTTYVKRLIREDIKNHRA